jgi:hypothetical protein
MGASPDTARSCATNKHNKARECLDAVGTFDKEGAPVRINVRRSIFWLSVAWLLQVLVLPHCMSMHQRDVRFEGQ